MVKGCGGSNSDLSRPWTDTLCERQISKLVKQDGGAGRKMAGKCGKDTVACHVLEQKHCVSVKSLNWFNKKGEMEKSVVKIQWPVTSLDRHTV